MDLWKAHNTSHQKELLTEFEKKFGFTLVVPKFTALIADFNTFANYETFLKKDLKKSILSHEASFITYVTKQSMEKMDAGKFKKYLKTTSDGMNEARMSSIINSGTQSQLPFLASVFMNACIHKCIPIWFRTCGVEQMRQYFRKKPMDNCRIIYLKTLICLASNNAISQSLHILMNDNIYHLPITMVISSPGGSITAGRGILDVMHTIDKADILTVCNGMVASMAAVIWTFGDYRYCYPRAEILYHRGSSGSQGRDVRSLQLAWSRLDNMNVEIMNTVKEKVDEPFANFLELHINEKNEHNQDLILSAAALKFWNLVQKDTGIIGVLNADEDMKQKIDAYAIRIQEWKKSKLAELTAAQSEINKIVILPNLKLRF